MIALIDGEKIETNKVLISFQTDQEQAKSISDFAKREQRSVSSAIRVLITRGLAFSLIK